MDGTAAIIACLVSAGAVTALVPPARISAGVLPQGTRLPAIAVTSVSSTDRNILSPRGRRHVSERVQVTIMAADYPSQKAVLRAVKRACADKMPIVPGISAITVHTEGAGPDFMSDTGLIHQGSQDFIVRFNEET